MEGVKKAKDSYNQAHSSWTYAYTGNTVEAKKLRIIVAVEDGLVIVTLIEL